MITKIKDFFKKQKNRFVSWYKQTCYPVKRVILLLTLCSLVSFGLGSCSAKKPYKQASAASNDSVEIQDYIDIFTNYNGQLYVANGNTTLTKVFTGFTFRLRSSGLYILSKTAEQQLVNSQEFTISYLIPEGHAYIENRADTVVTFSNFAQYYSKLLTNELAIINVHGYSTVKYNSAVSLQSNFVRYEFILSNNTKLYITFTRPGSWASVPSDFNFTDYDTTYQYTSYSVVVHNSNSSAYSDGYTAGINAGYNSGYNVGYDAGKKVGEQTGYDNGVNEGIKQGEASGYTKGYNKGLSETLSSISPWQVLVDGVNNFFNAKLFGTVSLSVLLSVGLGIVLFTIFMHSLR
mgnify:CR=1 FL=1